MGILIDTVRISNYRAIKDMEITLSPLTLFVGANNAGKTTFLKALQLALGVDRKNISKEDFHEDGVKSSSMIMVDVRVISIDEEGERVHDFPDNWIENEFGNLVKTDSSARQYFCFRTKCYYDILRGYVVETSDLKQWPEYADWTNAKHEASKSYKPQSIPLFFIDAQRDIQNDLKDKYSYLGRITSEIKIDDGIVKGIEDQLEKLNKEIVAGSPILDHLKDKLEELNKTVNAEGAGVEISPINKKIRDLGKGLNINFQDTKTESFPLEYHGMGTRSWASLLTLKAYITWFQKLKDDDKKPYHPVLALEEPEAHLHPNAQRQLFSQLANIDGQKMISTHSPFVAAQCDLVNLRHFYRIGNELKVGQIFLSNKEDALIKSLISEMEANPGDIALKRTNNPQIAKLRQKKIGKLNSEEARKLRREVMNTRGELLFAKCLIMFEGETEEQALPIFAKKYFDAEPFELGFNFIGVGGNGNYYPFLLLAKFLNIPWFIFSDGEVVTINIVKKHIEDTFGVDAFDRLVELPAEDDFESYLIKAGYQAELISTINDIEGNEQYFPDKYIKVHNGQLGKKGTRDYESPGGVDRALLDCLSESKTKYSAKIAEVICNIAEGTGKTNIPSKIKDLFDKVEQVFKFKSK